MHVPFRLAVLLAGLLGFIALAYEILWTRLFSFLSSGRTQGFGGMLGFYLLGLAVGSLLSRWFQREGKTPGLLKLSRLVIAANIVGFLVVPAAARLIPYTVWPRLLFLVLAASAVMGTLLPLLCHFAIAPDERAGARMSYIYLANIIGAGAGSLVTGFLLMDVFRLWQISALLIAGATVLTIALSLRSRSARPVDYALWATGAALVFTASPLHERLYERLLYAEEFKPATHFAQVVESRHGVVTITTNRLVYGGGVYDGVIDTSFTNGSTIVRPYFVSAIHPNPEEVLVIGMSAGAWTQILANHPQVKHVTVVEISEAYLKVVAAWPEVSSVLTNAKVEIVIDDGRRWLRRNPERRFDAIMMNTTFYYREFAAALLSREFISMARDHLRPGGFVMWNTTGSPRVARTGMEVFPHTMMVFNNCVGSMNPLKVDRERWRSVLADYRIDGAPVFDLASQAGREEFERVMSFGNVAPHEHPSWRTMTRDEMAVCYGKAEIITDDNLGSEYAIPMKAFAASAIPAIKRILYPKIF